VRLSVAGDRGKRDGDGCGGGETNRDSGHVPASSLVRQSDSALA